MREHEIVQDESIENVLLLFFKRETKKKKNIRGIFVNKV